MDDLICRYPTASLYQSHFTFIDSNGSKLKDCLPMESVQDVSRFLNDQFLQILDSTGTGYMMRSADYDKIGGIPNYPKLLFADYELWVRLTGLSFKATSTSITFKYRVHNSTSKLTNAIEYQSAFIRYCNFLNEYKEVNRDVNAIIKKNGYIFIDYYCTSLSHRLLQTPKAERSKTVNDFVQECITVSIKLLGSNNKFRPYRKLSILIAILIDNSRLGLYAFSLYKKTTR